MPLLARSWIVCLLMFVSLWQLGAIAWAQDDGESVEQARDRFRQSASRIQFRYEGSERPLTRTETPVLNWSNPERNTIVGVLFLWTDQARPQVAMCIYPTAPNHFDIELQSLSEEPLIAEEAGRVIWQPTDAGIQWRDLKTRAAAGKSPAARLVQMRRLARSFSANLVFDDKADKQLRLQTTPVYRYGVDNLPDDVVDGAVFTFVQGTDPEVLLMLEAHEAERSGRKVAAWRYALARMTMVASEVSFESEAVWRTQWARQGVTSSYNTIKR